MNAHLVMRIFAALVLLASTDGLIAEEFQLDVQQITHGPHHHFFGYIGQSLTIPWNENGRYILALRTDFHDRMPRPEDAADIVLIDTRNDCRIIPIDKTRAWNFQQGTMFYWHPRRAKTQFFFNDRDPQTGRVFTVLYDVEQHRRLREYRFDEVPVANGGVSPRGDFFLAINYGRMARLRPVTGYPDAADPTEGELAPENDGLFRVDIDSGQRQLLVSFRQLRESLGNDPPESEQAAFYINHSLCNREGKYVYFYARGRVGTEAMAVNVPFSIRTDGTELQRQRFIGGHPEWDTGTVVIGTKDDRQVRYDIKQRAVIGQLGEERTFPNPGGDISLSPNSQWFANGYSTDGGKINRYVLLRRADGVTLRSAPFSRGPYTDGALRIDPAPRWNRDGTALLIPGFTKDGTRQLHILRIEAK